MIEWLWEVLPVKADFTVELGRGSMKRSSGVCGGSGTIATAFIVYCLSVLCCCRKLAGSFIWPVHSPTCKRLLQMELNIAQLTVSTMCPLAFVISWFVPLQRAPATWLIYLPSLICFRHGVWAQGSTEYWANHTQLWHLVILPKYLLHILFLVLPSILRWDLVSVFLGC